MGGWLAGIREFPQWRTRVSWGLIDIKDIGPLACGIFPEEPKVMSQGLQNTSQIQYRQCLLRWVEVNSDAGGGGFKHCPRDVAGLAIRRSTVLRVAAFIEESFRQGKETS
jgi:hypothetical protein